jgi:3-oxoacyl-[acyl-carrier protein] reductase
MVTGASSGLGRATALALAEAGFDVAVLARDEGSLREVAAQIDASGRRALPLAVDLSDAVATASAASAAITSLGPVDLLVNAAGTDVPGTVAELAVEEWDRVQAVNLRAPYILARSLFPSMVQMGGGTIINISSVAGKRGWANAAAYCSSKFGLTGLTQALAAEGKPYGIRACIVYPGGMATHWGSWSADERQDERSPMDPARALPPARVASLIVWIATAPPEVVLNEAIISPLQEEGWP